MTKKTKKNVKVKNTKEMLNRNTQREEIGDILESLLKRKSYPIFRLNFLILLLMMKSYMCQITVSKEEKDLIYLFFTKIKKGKISCSKLCTDL